MLICPLNLVLMILAHLIKEANLAFALNTHLFSLIRPIDLTDSTAQKPKRELRYFERRELERQEREKQLLLTQEPVVPNTWSERIERFALFAVTAALGVFLSQVVLPRITAYLGPTVGSESHNEL